MAKSKSQSGVTRLRRISSPAPADAIQSGTVTTVTLSQLESHLATLEEIRAKDGNLSIPIRVTPVSNNGSSTNPASGVNPDLAGALAGWLESSGHVRKSLDSLLSNTTVR
jgi:hypothetical protein